MDLLFGKIVDPLFCKIVDPVFDRMVDPFFDRVVDPVFDQIVDPFSGPLWPLIVPPRRPRFRAEKKADFCEDAFYATGFRPQKIFL